VAVYWAGATLAYDNNGNLDQRSMQVHPDIADIDGRWLLRPVRTASSSEAVRAATDHIRQIARTYGGRHVESRPLGKGFDRVRPMARHYLYFPEERFARDAGEVLSVGGYDLEVRIGRDEENWLLLVAQQVDPAGSEEALSAARQHVEEVASRYRGDYDGWEVEVA
jgi:Regulator of ribonuclease activity B